VFKRHKHDEPRGSEPAADETHALDVNAPSESGSPQMASFRPARGGGPAHSGSAHGADGGLGVPPYRPVPGKETPVGVRPPLASPTAPGANPAARAAGASAARFPGKEPGEVRTLVVGRGISVQGSVQDAERLVVEGTLEANMIQAASLLIAAGGLVRGEITVDEAEIAGTMDGTLTAKENLSVRASGRLKGVTRYRRLQVEDGGQISGQLEMLSEPSKPASVQPVTEPAG
jgi:cytoskeletal protein CcmA (bactofilin family)